MLSLQLQRAAMSGGARSGASPARRLIRILAAALLAAALAWPAAAITVGLTRFGLCGPTDVCTLTILDGDPIHDLAPAVPGVIVFNEVLGGAPSGSFVVSGTAIETVFRDAANRVTGILLTLTDFQSPTMLGLTGSTDFGNFQGRVLGQVALVSEAVLIGGPPVSGFANLAGNYVSADGTVGFADLLAIAQVGGAVVGIADPAAGINVPDLTPFLAFNSRTVLVPVAAPLIATINFELAPSDGILLPASGEFFATVPEPASATLLAAAGVGAALLARRRRPT
jgi:hypothetical protein